MVEMVADKTKEYRSRIQPILYKPVSISSDLHSSFPANKSTLTGSSAVSTDTESPSVAIVLSNKWTKLSYAY